MTTFDLHREPSYGQEPPAAPRRPCRVVAALCLAGAVAIGSVAFVVIRQASHQAALRAACQDQAVAYGVPRDARVTHAETTTSDGATFVTVAVEWSEQGQPQTGTVTCRLDDPSADPTVVGVERDLSPIS